MYRLLKKLLFCWDPEQVHDVVMKLGQSLRWRPLRWLVRSFFRFESPLLAQDLWGQRFKNPVGLAAGFDKPGQAIDLFSSLGFGFLELGTITPEPQAGNPKPRIFRFPAKRALVNRMGFPSEGVDRLMPNLQRCFGKSEYPVLGVNIGKNKNTPIDEALKDYLGVLERVGSVAHYVVVNVSSPNTPELRKLQEPERLQQLFEGLQSVVQNVPILVKIAPDLNEIELRSILAVIKHCRVSGIVATNTTLDRSVLPEGIDEVGGVSGAPLKPKSVEIVKLLYRELQGSIPIIGVGGICCGADAEEFIRSGANLVQVYTGLIYEGPGLVRSINRHLERVLRKEGLTSIGELVGRGK